MKKQITQEQINAVLQVVYQTNISAATFDGLKKMFSELKDAPKSEEVKEETPA